MTAGNRLLGNFRLGGIRPAMRGVPQIEVTFEIDTNGIVHVSARDMATGRQQEITITASSNLSQSEIDRAIREARQYEEEDKRRKAEANAAHEAETLLYRANELSKKLSREDRKRLDEACSRLKKAMKSKDGARISQECSALAQMLDALGPQA